MRLVKRLLRVYPRLYNLLRGLRDSLRRPRQFHGIVGRIHPKDFMLGGHTPELLAVYDRIGRGALQLTVDGLVAAGRSLDDVRSLLDYGCGYGRVTRVFAQRMPPAAITAFDVDAAAARFCRDEFGVKALAFDGEWDFRSVGFGRYDCVWVGSVFTHLSESYTEETMQLLVSLLQPRGVLVFTTHGEEALRRADVPSWFGDGIHSKRNEIREAYRRCGFHFMPYARAELEVLPFEFQRPADFGVTWMSEPYTRALLQRLSDGHLQVREFRPAGWEGYQDVFFCQRT